MREGQVRELYQEQRFISTMLDTIDALIIVKEVRGKIVCYNAACERLTGYKLSEMMDKPIWEYLLIPEEVEYVKNCFQKLIDGQEHLEAENHWVTKSGEIKLIKWSSTTTRDRNGEVEFIVSSGIDITEQRRMDGELLQSEEKHRTLFETIPLGVLYIDQKGKIISSNPAANRILGNSKRNMKEHSLGTALFKMIHENGREFLLTEHPTYVAFKTGKEVNNVVMGLFYSEEECIWINIHAIPLFKTGEAKPYQVYVTLEDITEQKLAQEEIARLDRLNLIGQMGAGLGHEVRNPMTTVKGFLQFLGAKEEYLKDKDYFDLMIDEIDRANSIINEFLSIARTKPLELTIDNLNEIINRIHPLLEGHAYNINKEVLLDLAPIPDLLLNQREIQQLILNLVRNGLEAVPEGGLVQIKTYVKRSEIILEIKDNGKGIDPRVLERLGTPFLTTKPHGTGLGLAICYGIAARHYAKIETRTGPKGTSFFIKFKKTRK